MSEAVDMDLSSPPHDIRFGEIYQHYKGGFYLPIGIGIPSLYVPPFGLSKVGEAFHSETMEHWTVYPCRGRISGVSFTAHPNVPESRRIAYTTQDHHLVVYIPMRERRGKSDGMPHLCVRPLCLWADHVIMHHLDTGEWKTDIEMGIAREEGKRDQYRVVEIYSGPRFKLA